LAPDLTVIFLCVKKLPPYTLAGFDHKTHNSADGDNATRPRRRAMAGLTDLDVVLQSRRDPPGAVQTLIARTRTRPEAVTVRGVRCRGRKLTRFTPQKVLYKITPLTAHRT
jgi:hypothetical protein